MDRTIKFTTGLILFCLIGFLLISGRNLLIPIVIAIFIWNLLNILNDALRRAPVVGARLPDWLSWVLSLLLLSCFVLVLIGIIGNNVNDVIRASSRYQANLSRILAGVEQHYHIKSFGSFDVFLKNVDVQAILVNIYNTFTLLMSSGLLIGLYVVFLFVEQHYFKQKKDLLFSQAEHRQLVDSITSQIVKDTQTYLGLKTLMGLITAILSWIIMTWVGLDFAQFWALLIFFLNYIPNIGAIIATAFPAVLALIQFQNWVPFAVITSGLVAVQFVIGNLIEPRYLGRSLNLSPLVILFALSLWGMIWGILGMFLSVPITVIMMIVFAHFKSTRPIAILLSQDGRVKEL